MKIKFTPHIRGSIKYNIKKQQGKASEFFSAVIKKECGDLREGMYFLKHVPGLTTRLSSIVVVIEGTAYFYGNHTSEDIWNAFFQDVDHYNFCRLEAGLQRILRKNPHISGYFQDFVQKYFRGYLQHNISKKVWRHARYQRIKIIGR